MLVSRGGQGKEVKMNSRRINRYLAVSASIICSQAGPHGATKFAKVNKAQQRESEKAVRKRKCLSWSLDG